MNRLSIIPFLLILTFITLFSSCSSDEVKKSEGITLRQSANDTLLSEQKDFANLNTKPNTVLLTGLASHRLVTIYKEKYDKRSNQPYIDGNYYYSNNHNDYYDKANNWNNHFMPGIEAIYGYNLLNISHYNLSTKESNLFFESPVLINTLYYPALEQDTLNYQPINRNYYMVSVYDEDTNNDSLINYKDLRRFYHFDENGKNKTPLVPLDYSVIKSEYDSKNDLMYVFAQHDKNKNGSKESDEPLHVFWIKLEAPKMGERLY